MRFSVKVSYLLVGLLFAINNAHSVEPKINWGGYVDTQYSMTRNQGASLSDTFVLNNGALQMTGTIGGMEAVLDIAVNGNLAGVNTLTLGANNSQAYGQYSFGNAWIRAGHFDSLYGFEVNDTNQLQLSRQGIVFLNTVPFVHTGVAFGYKISPDWETILLVANPADSGLMNGAAPEVGFRLAGKVGTTRTSAALA